MWDVYNTRLREKHVKPYQENRLDGHKYRMW